MNATIVVPLLGLALLDSLNPSTLVISGLVAADAAKTGRSPWGRLSCYLAGLLTVMVTFGVLVMLGAHRLPDVSARSDGTYIVQAVVGVVLLAIGLLPDTSRRTNGARRLAVARTPGAMFGLGLVIALVEFAGAVPYVAALALMVTNNLPVAWWLPLLVLYNLVVIVPPIALVALSRAGLFKDAIAKTSSLRTSLRPLVLTLAFVLGLYLVADAAYYFNVFNLFDGAPPHPATRRGAS